MGGRRSYRLCLSLEGGFLIISRRGEESGLVGEVGPEGGIFK